jgi:hypothetical protein
MKITIALIAGLLLARAPAAASPALDQALLSARIPIEHSADGRYSGLGWDRLIDDGRDAQFFLIGEQHGGAEIIDFAAAVHKELAGAGYSHAALEVGPYSTEYVETLIRTGGFQAFLKRPGSNSIFPFLFWDEERVLAEQYVALSPDRRRALWGLDQEYLGAAPVVLERLRQRAKRPDQRLLVESLQTRAATDRQLVMTLENRDFQQLVESFASDAQALEIIEAMRISNGIYAPFRGPSATRYWGNLTRETYIKTNFARYFTETERRLGKPPKVFAKFGGSHAMRGITQTTVPGFGNFLAEWGLARGFKLVNMMVDCASSAEPPARPCQPYFGTDSRIFALAPKDRLTLYDLRPIRSQLRGLGDVDTKTRDLIQAFDFYLLIPNVTPAISVTKKAAANTAASS